MNDNITQPQQNHSDVIDTLVNPNWNKASTSWMAMSIASMAYGVVNPCIEVLFGCGILFMLLSFIAYKAGKKNNGGS